MKNNGTVTNKIVTFGESENLITTTNLKGVITYINSGYKL